MEDNNQIIMESTDKSEPSSSSPPNPNNNDSSVSEAEIFDRIANKLLRSGLLLTALELHTELIERGKESSRLRDFFDNPHNFEKHFDTSPTIATTSNISGGGVGLNKLSTLSISNNNSDPNRESNSDQQQLSRRTPSDKTFDSLDFTHYSDDDDLDRHGDERIAVLEFELRKAQQTINSLRASLTMSTTGGQYINDDIDGGKDNQIDQMDCGKDLLNSNDNDNKNSINQLLDHHHNHQTNHQFFDQNYSLIRDFYFRGSGDGDSCPGEDDKFNNNNNNNKSNAITNTNDTNNILTNNSESSSSTTIITAATTTITNNNNSSSLTIKPHERRALNYLINEYLMENNYKLTSITFCDENTEQDFDNWNDVGLNINRPPDLLKLFRNFWKNFGNTNNTINNNNNNNNQAIASTSSSSILIRSNSNLTND